MERPSSLRKKTHLWHPQHPPQYLRNKWQWMEQKQSMTRGSHKYLPRGGLHGGKFPSSIWSSSQSVNQAPGIRCVANSSSWMYTFPVETIHGACFFCLVGVRHEGLAKVRGGQDRRVGEAAGTQPPAERREIACCRGLLRAERMGSDRDYTN